MARILRDAEKNATFIALGNSMTKAAEAYANGPMARILRDAEKNATFMALGNSMTKAAEAYANGPMARILRDAEKKTAFMALGNSMTKAAEAYANGPMARILRDAEKNAAFIARANSMTKAAEAYANGPMAQIAREFEKSSAFAVLNTLNRLGVQPAFANLTAEKIAALQDAITDTDETDIVVVPADVERLFGDLFQFLLDAINEATQKIEIRQVAKFIWQLFPIILTLAIYYASSQEMEAFREETQSQSSEIQDMIGNMAGQIEESDDRITSRLDELVERMGQRLEESEAGTFYLVLRPVPLNEGQKLTGPAMLCLFPGDEVELIERRGKWIRVVAYDALSAQTHIGWVLKKYLRKLW